MPKHKLHGYSFYLSDTARFVFDRNRTKVHDLIIKNAVPVARVAAQILADPAAQGFNAKLRDQLQTATEIEKTRNAAKGIGAARGATTDPTLPFYMKIALYEVLDHTDPPNCNWAQSWGLLEGTWAKVAACLEGASRLCLYWKDC